MDKLLLLKLNGTDKKLYRLISPFTMDAEVIKKLDGYPVLTSETHTWYILMENKKVAGFSSCKNQVRKFALQDLYVIDESKRPEIAKSLISEMLKDFNSSEYTICSVTCRNEEKPIYVDNGFKLKRKVTNWFIMEKTKK